MDLRKIILQTFLVIFLKNAFVASQCSNFYTVFQEDTCENIAAAYFINQNILLQLNPGLNCLSLPIGQRLCVPYRGTQYPSCQNYYTIYSDDVCANIAAAYGISQSTLISLNPSLNCASLIPGTVICVPIPGSGSSGTVTCQNYYSVFQGDTCDNIAAAYRITSSSLILLNPGLNCANLVAGQRICVPAITPATVSPITASPVTCQNYYSIFQGDTCDNIASAYRIITSTLIFLNPGLNCASLVVGQRICVPAISPATVSPVTVNPYTCQNYYSIFQGDTCDNIASAYRITSSALVLLNPGLNCANLVVGQRICVPALSPATVSPVTVNPFTCQNFYSVFQGDTCDNIASAYRITSSALGLLNPGLNCANLVVGQRICVPTVNPATISPVTVSPTTCQNYYSIFQGDTCDNIALAYRITTSALIVLNPGLNCVSLVVGQRICVPSIYPVPYVPVACSSYYTIVQGDTCEKIATAYQTLVTGLLILNPGLNCVNLQVGKQICVPSATPGTLNPSTCSNYYTIYPGDTCPMIESMFGTSLIVIYSLNPSLNCNNLLAGSVICVPFTNTVVTPAPAPVSCTNYYSVMNGDICYSIASQYQITLNQLYTLNPGINCNNMYIGQSVCVASSTIQGGSSAYPVQQCTSFYRIVNGDSCTNIAYNYGIPINSFYSFNQGITCSNLRIGDIVCLSVQNAITCTFNYVVKDGDTCYALALRYGISLSNFTSKLNCNNLRPGQVICI